MEQGDVAAEDDVVLRVRGLTRSYGTILALDGVDIDIAQGEVVGLLGPNGAGKTTLISIIAGLRAPDRGSVHVCGRDVQKDPLAARRMLGIAPQELAVYLQLSVRANLRFFGRMAGLGRLQLKERIEAVTHALELEEVLDRRPQELSGGEKRRVHTAIAILHRAPLLLLDEPTVGVDVHTRNRLIEVVKSLAYDGAAICYTTHYLHEVESVAASVVILDHGTVIAKGRVKDLIAASGGAVVEVSVEGSVPPELAALGTVDGDSSLVRIQAPDPGAAITRALSTLDHDPDRIRSIEVVRPSLESVYLSVTGRRFDVTATEGDDR
jgi:ABC-2 type transport system ATP-binding protein